MNLILLGAPGAGKGTQTAYLQRKYSLTSVSTGNLIRAEIQAGTPLGNSVKEIVEAGQFPSDEIIINLVQGLMKTSGSCAGYIFDGVPRTLNQAQILDMMLSGMGCQVDKVIQLDVDYPLLTKRLSGRFTCASCGEMYNDHTKPLKHEGVCDKCGHTEFTRRADDSLEAVSTRLQVYRDTTAPLVDYYAHQEKLSVVNGMQDIAQVSRDLDKILEASAHNACAHA